MKIRAAFFSLVPVVLFLFGCSTQNNEIENSIYSKDYWEGFESMTIAERTMPCSDANVIKTVNQWKIDREQEPDIQETKLTEDEKEVLQNFLVLFSKWPVNIKEYFNAHVARIYIVENLGTSGKAECMDDGNTFVVFINKSVLHEDPNEWISKAEASAILFDQLNERIEIKIEEFTSAEYTIENIIIHELGHIVARNLEYIPDWRENNAKVEKEYPFLKKEFYYESQEFHRVNPTDEQFDIIWYYGKEEDKISLNNYLYLCQYMNETTYPTIYGSRNIHEYFAELFYGYFHCVIQNRKYELSITDSEGANYKFANGIVEERCKSERMIMKKIIEDLKK